MNIRHASEDEGDLSEGGVVSLGHGYTLLRLQWEALFVQLTRYATRRAMRYGLCQGKMSHYFHPPLLSRSSELAEIVTHDAFFV